MNPQSFTDIKITGLETAATQPSDRAAGLRHMFLRLSASPTTEWQELFDNERQFPRHTMWREAWIQGDFIVVDCVPEEIAQHHLHDLKQDVANANKNYRDHLEQVAQAERQQRAADDQERSRLDELKSRLKFD